MALHDAGLLDIIAVGSDSRVEPQKAGGIIYCYDDEQGVPQAIAYKTFVDCVGQPHLSYDDMPFPGLIANKTISPARLQFRSQEKGSAAVMAGDKAVFQDAGGNYFLNVPGISINDKFQVLDQYGAYSDRIYIMAVPYIGGFNPDYSGLDFCEAASEKIVNALFT